MEVGQLGPADKTGGGGRCWEQDGFNGEEAAAEKEARDWAAYGGYVGKGTPCNRARVFVQRLSASVGVLGWRADSQHSLAFVPLYSGLRSQVQIPL